MKKQTSTILPWAHSGKIRDRGDIPLRASGYLSAAGPHTGSELDEEPAASRHPALVCCKPDDSFCRGYGTLWHGLRRCQHLGGE